MRIKEVNSARILNSPLLVERSAHRNEVIRDRHRQPKLISCAVRARLQQRRKERTAEKIIDVDGADIRDGAFIAERHANHDQVIRYGYRIAKLIANQSARTGY